MGRNNLKNITEHNEKLHKAKNKEKAKKSTREEKLKAIARNFNKTKD